MAVPKKKTSPSRQGQRRAHHHLRAPTINECPQCHEVKRPHHICPHCGYYKEKEIVEVEVV
ncbi:MAG: 50S ribosomal protein L32 [Nitrospinae bacterium]|nr:50S ribosomal protein L32 [Nitrospinota bacterium]